jgi:hypothetical protein
MAALACSCANARITFLFFHQACFTILKGLFTMFRLCAWRRIAPPGVRSERPYPLFFTPRRGPETHLTGGIYPLFKTDDFMFKHFFTESPFKPIKTVRWVGRRRQYVATLACSCANVRITFLFLPGLFYDFKGTVHLV